MESLFSTKVKAIGGRNGKVESLDNNLIDMEVKMPKGLGGPGGEYTNPEQLFAAGYSACFDGALNHIAKLQRIKLGVTEIIAEIGLQKDGEGLKLVGAITAKIPGVEKAVAEELLKAAHQACPYSKAIRNNVEVELTLVQ